MYTTESSSAEESRDWYSIDPKILVGSICGVTFVLATIAIAVCCSCCWRKKPRNRNQHPKQQQQQQQNQQAFVIPISGGQPGQPGVIVINNPQHQGASLPGYNQQHPQHMGTHPGAQGRRPGAPPSSRPGNQGYVARAQNRGPPPANQQQQQQNTQNRKPPPSKDKKNKNIKQKNENNKGMGHEFRMSGLENKPSVEANKYIKFEVPAPASQERKESSVTAESELDKIAKYITRSITKVLESINIDHEKIKRHDILGSGQFGVVYKGEMTSDDKSRTTHVALKTVVGDSNDEDGLQEFMDELLRMKNFNHPNVMPVLGMTIMEERPYMVLPFMSNGDLRSFLSKTAMVFTVEDLLRLSLQISRGMEYLSGQNIIHGDLAARNCMVGKDDIVKVADFGLSRHLFQSDYYSLNQSEALRPFRWMAVECLLTQKFTTKSDVWSFGILLWEVMTRGQKPYPDTPSNSEVMEKLKNKYRMPCPQYCAEEIYEVMTRCWDEDPNNRPSFKDATKMIQLLLEQAGGDYEKPVSSVSD